MFSTVGTLWSFKYGVGMEKENSSFVSFCVSCFVLALVCLESFASKNKKKTEKYLLVFLLVLGLIIPYLDVQ